MDAPESVKTLLHYLNAQPTKATWRRIVLGPVAKLILPSGAKPPELPTFGVKSLEEFQSMLEEFRAFACRWINLESAYSMEAEELLRAINLKSQLQFKGWALIRDDGRLIEEWGTEHDSFTELLYSKMAIALKEVPFRTIHRCEGCEKFFWEPSKRQVKYCSAACRNRVTVRRFREKQAEGARHKAHESPKRKRRGHQSSAKGSK